VPETAACSGTTQTPFNLRTSATFSISRPFLTGPALSPHLETGAPQRFGPGGFGSVVRGHPDFVGRSKKKKAHEDTRFSPPLRARKGAVASQNAPVPPGSWIDNLDGRPARRGTAATLASDDILRVAPYKRPGRRESCVRRPRPAASFSALRSRPPRVRDPSTRSRAQSSPIAIDYRMRPPRSARDAARAKMSSCTPKYRLNGRRIPSLLPTRPH